MSAELNTFCWHKIVLRIAPQNTITTRNRKEVPRMLRMTSTPPTICLWRGAKRNALNEHINSLSASTCMWTERRDECRETLATIVAEWKVGGNCEGGLGQWDSLDIGKGVQIEVYLKLRYTPRQRGPLDCLNRSVSEPTCRWAMANRCGINIGESTDRNRRNFSN